MIIKISGSDWFWWFNGRSLVATVCIVATLDHVAISSERPYSNGMVSRVASNVSICQNTDENKHRDSYLWNPLSLKKMCHLLWLSSRTFVNVEVDSGLNPVHEGMYFDSGEEGAGNSLKSVEVDMVDSL